jgi:hypothetical protein
MSEEKESETRKRCKSFCCHSDRHSEVEQWIWIVIMIYVIFLVTTWMFFGIFCINDCGTTSTIATVSKVYVKIRVCQSDGDDFRQYPYTGFVQWRINGTYQNRSLSFYFDERVSCASDESGAYEKAIKRFNVGDDRKGWYWVEEDSDGHVYGFLTWMKAVDNPTIWFYVNVLSSFVGIGILIVSILLMLIRRCIIRHLDSYQHRNVRVDPNKEEEGSKKEKEPLLEVIN